MESGSDLPGGGAGSLTSPGRGGILYCVIARGTTVLARFSCLVSYDRCGWFFIQSLGMPPVLGTLQRSVILFWQRQDLLPPSSALTTFILIGARPQPAQDDTDSGRIPLPLCLWRRGDCLGHCRCRVLLVFLYSNFFLRSRLCLWSRRGVQILRLGVGQVLKTVWAESPLSNCLRHEHRVQPRHCQVILVIALGKKVAQFENFFVFSEIKRFSKKASDSSSAGDPDKITTWAWTLFNIKFLSIVFQYLQWPMIRTSQA